MDSMAYAPLTKGPGNPSSNICALVLASGHALHGAHKGSSLQVEPKEGDPSSVPNALDISSHGARSIYGEVRQHWGSIRRPSNPYPIQRYALGL